MLMAVKKVLYNQLDIPRLSCAVYQLASDEMKPLCQLYGEWKHSWDFTLSFQSRGTWRIIRIEAIVGRKKPHRRSVKYGKVEFLSSSLLVLPIILLGPVEVVALGERQAFQVSVFSPFLQPLLFQDGHQCVSFLHRPHDLRQDLLLFLQFRGALFCVCRQRRIDMQTVYFQLVYLRIQTVANFFFSAHHNPKKVHVVAKEVAGRQFHRSHLLHTGAKSSE